MSPQPERGSTQDTEMAIIDIVVSMNGVFEGSVPHSKRSLSELREHLDLASTPRSTCTPDEFPQGYKPASDSLARQITLSV